MKKIIFFTGLIILIFGISYAIQVSDPPPLLIRHDLLINLDYANSGHTGFAASGGNNITDFKVNNLYASGSGVFGSNLYINNSQIVASMGSIPKNASFTLAGLSEKDYNNLTNKPTSASWTYSELIGTPTNASWTLAGLSEKDYNNLTNKPTSASWTYSELIGTPTNASWTLAGLSEKDYNNLTNKPTSASWTYSELIGTPTNASWAFAYLNDIPSFTSNAGKYFRLKNDESGAEWVDGNVIGGNDSYVLFSGSSFNSTTTLYLTPNNIELIRLSATDTMRFLCDVAMFSEDKFAGFKLEGTLVRNQLIGTRFVGNVIKTSWLSGSSNLFDITASYTSAGVLELIASCPANSKIKAIVRPTRNFGRIYNEISTYLIGNSLLTTSTLELTPYDVNALTLSSSGTMKFYADIAMVSSNFNENTGITLEGVMAKNDVLGTYFVENIVKTVWNSGNNLCDCNASYSNGVLKFIASGPANLSVNANVFISKVQVASFYDNLSVKNISIKSENCTLNNFEDIIKLDASAASFTIFLPSASLVKGKVYTLKKIDNSTNTITLQPYGTELIDNLTSINIEQPNVAIDIVSDGLNWLIL